MDIISIVGLWVFWLLVFSGAIGVLFYLWVIIRRACRRPVRDEKLRKRRYFPG